MVNILEFIFQSFWHFIGCVVILNVVLANTVRLIRGNNYSDMIDELAKLRGEVESLKIKINESRE